MANQRQSANRFTGPPTISSPPTSSSPPLLRSLRALSSSSPPASVMHANDNSEWLAMFHAQPWRSQPPPPQSPLSGPPRGQLRQDPRQIHTHFPSHHILRYAEPSEYGPSRLQDDGERLTSTAMRFLSRELPYRSGRREEQQVSPLFRENGQGREDFLSSERSVLPSLRQWVDPSPAVPAIHPQRVPSFLPPLTDRHSISSYFSDTTLPSSGCSTPIESASAVPVQAQAQSLSRDHTASAWLPSPREGDPRPVTAEASTSHFPSMHGRTGAAFPWNGSPAMAFAASAASPIVRPFETAQRPRSTTNTTAAPAQEATSSSSQKKKKRRTPRKCTTDGCDKLVVDRGVCIRHGGGKRCSVEGCTCRAQNRGLCWKHGGYTICQIDGCDKRAKSRGMCWSHGGGTQCKTDGCEKIAVSRGCCWAHGGGKRCKVDDCKKPAALRTDDFCAEHYARNRELQRSLVPRPSQEPDTLRPYGDLYESKMGW